MYWNNECLILVSYLRTGVHSHIVGLCPRPQCICLASSSLRPAEVCVLSQTVNWRSILRCVDSASTFCEEQPAIFAQYLSAHDAFTFSNRLGEKNRWNVKPKQETSTIFKNAILFGVNLSSDLYTMFTTAAVQCRQEVRTTMTPISPVRTG